MVQTPFYTTPLSFAVRGPADRRPVEHPCPVVDVKVGRNRIAAIETSPAAVGPTRSRESARPKVLVGFAEALSAPEVVWSLADAGFDVCAFGRRGRRSALRHSRYVTVTEVTPPETDAAAAVRDVGELVGSLVRSSRERRSVLFPLDDAAVWLCDAIATSTKNGSGAAPERDLNVVLAGPSGQQVSVALDKALQLDTARRAGFNVLPTRVARTKDEVLLGENSFPLVLKPSKAVAWVNGKLQKGRIWICGNRAELEQALRTWTETVPLLVQPYVVGRGEGVFGLSRAGGVEAISAHRRIRMMNPHGSGSSACASQPVPARLALAAEQFVRVADWQGLFMIEMLRDAEGTAWFMEFNGRPWGSLALARRQGLEYPAWNAHLALDASWRPTRIPSLHPDLVCRHLGRELMHPLFVLKGPKSAALTEWPPLWKSVVQVLNVRSGQSLYNWRHDDKRVFFADCVNTLLDNLTKTRPD